MTMSKSIYPKMNPKAKKTWVKALRSGQYTQADQYLCIESQPGSGPAFCCLGVLCEELGDGHWTFFDVTAVNAVPHWRYSHEDQKTAHCGIPPLSFMKSIGLDPEAADELACMNDKGKSFDQIADYIVANL